MATAHVVVVKLLIDADNEAETCDGITSLLSEHLQYDEPDSCLLDWEYVLTPVEVAIPEGYEPDDGIPDPSMEML